MIVCHCKAVNDRSIRQAVRRGASTRRQVTLACAAGRACGGCVPVIDAILSEEQGDARCSEGSPGHIDRAVAG